MAKVNVKHEVSVEMKAMAWLDRACHLINQTPLPDTGPYSRSSSKSSSVPPSKDVKLVRLNPKN